MNAPISTLHPSGSIRSETRVVLLLADGVSLTTVSAALEPFQHANTCMRRQRFDVQLVSLGDDDPMTQSGIPIPCDAAAETVLALCNTISRPDLVVFCCGQSMDTVSRELLQRFLRRLLRTRIPFFTLGSACEVIAGTGRRNGGKYAAHWKSLASLEERFPQTQFDNVLYSYDGRVTSCAGELATFDLIVDFIEQVCGPRVSNEICHHFLASGRRSGDTLQFLAADAATCKDERFLRALDIMTENIEAPVTMAELAQRIGLSTRQVERVFAQNGLPPPLKYYVRLRLNRAHQLLEQTQMSLIEIAVACGFENQSSFSKNYKRAFGVSPLAQRNMKKLCQAVPSPGSCT